MYDKAKLKIFKIFLSQEAKAIQTSRQILKENALMLSFGPVPAKTTPLVPVLGPTVCWGINYPF